MKSRPGLRGNKYECEGSVDSGLAWPRIRNNASINKSLTQEIALPQPTLLEPQLWAHQSASS